MQTQGVDEMILSEVFDRFVESSPVTVMVRATMQNVLSDERLDRLFDTTAARQRTSELLFSTLVDLMSEVVCRIHPSVHAAYQKRQEEIQVSVKALYDKLRRVEPSVSQALVRDTATRMGAIVRRTGGALAELLPGYRVLIADGNHFPATERRLKELRGQNVAPLPGHAVAVLDPALMLAVDVFPCPDGHASERKLLPELLQTLRAKDLLLADRNFCTTNFLWDIADRKAFFLIRQHASSLKCELLGKRKRVGRIATGVVYEQSLQIFGRNNQTRTIRRITIALDRATSSGDREIHILTNLPAKVSALKAAMLYQRRWRVEGMFQEMEAYLHSEIDTLAYPQAALFAFCLALVSYNVLSVVKAALRGAHGHERIQQEFSNYYVAHEVSGMWLGMTTLLPNEFWEERFAKLTPSEMAVFLLRCARKVDLKAFRKHPRGPKTKPLAKPSKKGRKHVSTQRILDQRKHQLA
jgi:hypothetical protein